MNLNKKELASTENIRKFIINNNSEEYLNKIRCKKCNGTGLDSANPNGTYGYSWSGEFCNYCKGLGFLNYEQIYKEIYDCPRCNGTGKYDRYNCVLCNGTGMVDWLTNIFGA